ncbi:oxidoreductase-like protein [Jannaschia sp. CCS1]|nr:oxidoreductase-like protein [Jannaschia sp. CCS1]
MAQRLAAHGQFDLAGIFAPEVDGYGTFEAICDDPSVDAVILTSPNDLHEAQSVAAALAGKHVFCEKPLSLTGASARRIVGAAQDAGVVLGIGHERRFEPAMQEVATMVRDGAFGTVMHVEAAFSHDKLAGLPKDNWRTRPALAPAAGMTGMGIHLTDFMIWMFGPVAQVQAVTADRSLGWETGDVVSVQLVFEAGMTATLSAILHTPHFIRYHVFGSDIWAEVRNDTHPDTPGGQAHLVISKGGGHTTESFPWTDAVVDNLTAFANAIEGTAPYPFTPHQMIHNIEVLEAIATSAATGGTVRL